ILTLDRTSLPDLIRSEREIADKQDFKSMMKKNLVIMKKNFFQIKAKRKYDHVEEENSEEKDVSTSPPVIQTETAIRSQQEDEQEQRLVNNKDVQSIEVINRFVHWHRRWYRSEPVDVYYTPFNITLEL
ncbi:unnamed protein product, partial [Rotaria sordida]